MASIASNVASSSRRQISKIVRPAVVASRSISSSPRSQLEVAAAAPDTTPPPPDLTTPNPRVQLLSFPKLNPLPRPHGIHVASLHLAAHHPYPLDLYTSFSLHAAHSLGIPTSNPAYLPTVTSLYTVLKSPFVHKKSQENFERRNHRRVIKVWDADRSVVDLWLRYLKKNGIGGVGMRAEVFEWVEPGEVGKELAGLGEKMQRAAEKMAGGEIMEEAERLKEDLSAKEEKSVEEPKETEKVEETTPDKELKDTVDGA